MSCFTCCTRGVQTRRFEDLHDDDHRPPRQQEELQEGADHGVKEREYSRIKFVHFTLMTLNESVNDILNEFDENVHSFTNENECIEYIKSIPDTIFLIIGGTLSTILIESIESFKQIDSVFFYSLPPNVITTLRQRNYPYMVKFCANSEELRRAIRKSSDERDQQLEISAMYNRKEKAAYHLPKERNSYKFFHLFKLILKDLPRNSQSKYVMTTICRKYYRRNSTELSNIDDFDHSYRAADAFIWFLKETFLYKFINKTLRIQNWNLLHSFHFYITDLSEQIQLKFNELKQRTPSNVFTLYREVKLSEDELMDYQNNIGNLVSNNEYLLTSSEYAVAHRFATRFAKEEGVVRAIIEYILDLNVVQNTTFADVRQYTLFPEQAPFLIDIGGLFQINSLEYNNEEDFWHIKLRATDSVPDSVTEYIEYQKIKMNESNILLYSGNLLLEMGEYSQAEQYFDTILNTADPNDEEIACIFYYLGRVHRSKGDFLRAMNCYNRALHIHMNARPKRRASAGKVMNSFGVVQIERGRISQAEVCLKRAMKLYKRSIPKYHVDVAGMLINLGTIDCHHGNFEQALKKYRKASKIYDRCLPPSHPDRALVKLNVGNVHLANENYSEALEEYQAALQLQEAMLPADHPYLAQTLHNLAIVHVRRENMDEAKYYLKRAEEIAKKGLSNKHPIMSLIHQTKELFINQERDCSDV